MRELRVGEKSCSVDRLPNTCPLCHHAIVPRFASGVFLQGNSVRRLDFDALFQCPEERCNRGFIGRYAGSDSTNVYRLTEVAPRTPEPTNFSKEVAAISPQFVLIYGQANTAESLHLDQIAGVGYRKALEFLIKDYCVSLEPARADEIRRKPLGAVIRDHVPDAGVKVCAERATWLGNDETHYVRKWEDKDVEDLKLLITLTASWVSAAEQTKAYLASMPKGK